jgi:hypothetical protein
MRTRDEPGASSDCERRVRDIMMGNSKGFRMRRDHEAKQELGITTDDDRRPTNAERPLSEQRAPNAPPQPERSLFKRLLKAITS